MLRVIAIAVLLTSVIFASGQANASSISAFMTDETTGWNHIDTRHMGSKFTTYTYDDSFTKQYYNTYVVNGIAMWGSLISCTEVSTGGIGEIAYTYSSLSATAYVTSSYDSSGHVTNWALTINGLNFEKDNDGGSRTIAHEIGHVYGLNHVDDPDKIMYGTYSTTKSITDSDKWGMRVMTHAHTHNLSDGTLIEFVGPSHHNIRCESCLAYKRIDCTYSSHWHLDNFHYFQYNCICGNNLLRKTPCSTTICPNQSVID